PPRPPISLDEPSWPGPLPPPVATYEPSDHGVRLEQLRNLAALRDSGALTEAEFQAEKRRMLGH
ncbi:MAG TPA: SHOCT domain-containing protein, partial [Mycobacterium sp.]